VAASTYQSALELAGSLKPEEQMRLVRELLSGSLGAQSSPAQSSLLELCGLGAEIWHLIDAQEYVHRERASWTG
jgi:hypothetical protein